MAINSSTPISDNENAKNGLSLNLSSNDLGSCIRQFMYELANNHSIAHLDLGDNSKAGILIYFFQKNFKI